MTEPKVNGAQFLYNDLSRRLIRLILESAPDTDPMVDVELRLVALIRDHARLAARVQELEGWQEEAFLDVIRARAEAKHLRERSVDCSNTEAENTRLRGDISFLLSLVPEWARDVPPGLDPTFYGTGTEDGDWNVKRRVDAIQTRWEKP